MNYSGTKTAHMVGIHDVLELLYCTCFSVT